jgi:hypothetical protein
MAVNGGKKGGGKYEGDFHGSCNRLKNVRGSKSFSASLFAASQFHTRFVPIVIDFVPTGHSGFARSPWLGSANLFA